MMTQPPQDPQFNPYVPGTRRAAHYPQQPPAEHRAGMYRPDVPVPPYPPLPPPSTDRRRKLGWWPYVAVVVAGILVAVTLILLLGDNQGDQEPKEPVKGSISQQWQAENQVTVAGYKAVQTFLVGVECVGQLDPAGVPSGGAAACVLRARHADSGAQAWRVEAIYGMTLTVVGDRIVVSGGLEAVVVRSTTGHVVKRLPHGLLLGYAGTTGVFYEKSAENVAHIVGVNLTDATHLWRHDADPALHTLASIRLARDAATIPSGFQPGYLDDLAASSRYVAIPDRDEKVIRSFADGSVVAQSQGSSRVVGVVGERVLRVEESGRKRTLVAAEPGSENSPGWRHDISDSASISTCSGLICIADLQEPSSELVNPTTGRTVAQHSGAILVRSVGDRAALIRCSDEADNADPTSCPLTTSTLDVIAVPSGDKLYSGQSPAFVSVASTTIYVGSSTQGSSDVTVVSVPTTNKNPVEYGMVKGYSPVLSIEEVFTDAAGSADQSSAWGGVENLTNMTCAVANESLICATRWAPQEPTMYLLSPPA